VCLEKLKGVFIRLQPFQTEHKTDKILINEHHPITQESKK
jgi:hypothetical protein